MALPITPEQKIPFFGSAFAKSSPWAHSRMSFALRTFAGRRVCLAPLVFARLYEYFSSIKAFAVHYKLVLQNHVDGLVGRSWTFTPPAVVGREPDAQVCVDHDSVSRKHCQFTLNGEGALVVRDVGSTNGTYVDDRKVDHATLMPGQELQIGALLLKIEFSVEPEVVQRPAPRPQGSVYATQPMQTFRPVPLPPEKPWWKRLFS
jgi:hypothetical protein